MLVSLASCTKNENNVIKDILDNISGQNIEKTMRDLESFQSRYLLASNEEEIAVYIENRLNESGVDSVIISTFVNTTVEYHLGSGSQVEKEYYNVVGFIKGSRMNSQLYVLGAHFDSYCMGREVDPYETAPGADNNASGVAAVLEIARVINEQGYVPENTIAFAFFGSEEFMTMFTEGKSGSEFFVSGLDPVDVLFMIDHNQIAYNPDSIPYMINFQECPESEGLTAIAIDACTTFTIISPVLASDHIRCSDVFYFWSAGIPSLFLEEYYFNPYTFTVWDITDKCNIDYVAEVAKISLATLMLYEMDLD